MATLRFLLAIVIGVLVVMSQPRIAEADETDKLLINFHQTTDDKDNQDEVCVTIFKDGKPISDEGKFGKGEVWRDKDDERDKGPFEILLYGKQETKGLVVRVKKTGSSDGWAFIMTVQTGDKKEVLKMGGRKFKDGDQQDEWRIPN